MKTLQEYQFVRTVECNRCDGKGHVINKEVMLFVPVVSWIIAALESDNADSDTRETCPKCKGKGYCHIPA